MRGVIDAATPEAARRPGARRIVGLALRATATVGLAFCVALAVRGIMAVAAVGGGCASGGPYASVQPCPKGTIFLFVGVFGGVLCLITLIGLAASGRFRGGPAWPPNVRLLIPCVSICALVAGVLLGIHAYDAWTR